MSGKASAVQPSRVERLGVEYVAHGSIKPNSYNPNRQSDHEFELLCRSITEDGFTQPVVVLRATREIVDGEHRWRACGKLGFAEIPVVFVDYPAEQARVATLQHNRARGKEDVALLTRVYRDLRDLDALDQAQHSLMLPDDHLSTLLEEASVLDGEAGVDFAASWNVPSSNIEPALATGADLSEVLPEFQPEDVEPEVTSSVSAFRLSLHFSGDDAEVVRAVLGDKPSAEHVVRLCTQFEEVLP